MFEPSAGEETDAPRLPKEDLSRSAVRSGSSGFSRFPEESALEVPSLPGPALQYSLSFQKGDRERPSMNNQPFTTVNALFSGAQRIERKRERGPQFSIKIPAELTMPSPSRTLTMEPRKKYS